MMRVIILIVLTAIVAAMVEIGLPSKSERLHIIRNGSRVCVYTRGSNGRVYPADAGACENLNLTERIDP